MKTAGYIERFMPIWDNYVLDKFLGSGSFGNVWQVIDEKDKNNVAAIKEVIIPPASAGTLESTCLQGLDLDNARRYFEETLTRAIAEAKMQHTLCDCINIVCFKDYVVKKLDKPDEFGWVLYILMDRVKPFTEYLMENGITVLTLIQLGMDLCCALKRCFEAGIVHRDIKPENIFYCEKRKCFQLGDFGIAHYVIRATESKGRPGTLTHMSPEVFQGNNFSYNDDLYAVGMIIYKLLNYNRIPLLPDYPEQYMPDQRDNALVSRLKGATLPLPAITKVKEENLNTVNSIRAGMRLQPNDLHFINELGKIALKAVFSNKSERYDDAMQLYDALSALKNKMEIYNG